MTRPERASAKISHSSPAVSGIYFARHGYEADTFPIIEPDDSPPARSPQHGTEQLRATLPRLAKST